MTNQQQAFLEGEADQWYQRNKYALAETAGCFMEIDWLCTQLAPFGGRIERAFEIGCGDGAKLRQVCQTLSCKGEGIDPSGLAVKNGNLSGDVQLHQGTASRLPCLSHSVDFVYFGFCLYLIDRSELLIAIAEANRVLKPGGFLAITDFDPIVPHKRPYHHKTGLFSYKQDYSKCFTESGLYYLVAKKSFSHRQDFFDADGDERISTTLMYKELDG